MDAKKCDRCGKYYTVKASRGSLPPYYVEDPNDLVNRKNKDLCPTCSEDLRKWYRKGQGVL